MARKRTLSDELAVLVPAPVVASPRAANQSASRLGSDRKRPKRYEIPSVQQNYAGPARTNTKGQSFDTFTRPDKPGMEFHEYVENGKRRVVGVKKRTGPRKGLGSSSIGG